LNGREIVRQVARLRTAAAAPYVGAVATRAAARTVWGLALPTALTVAAYGRYQLIATAAVMAAQIALLGTPQTIVRYTGRRLPTRLLTTHATVLAALAIALAVVFLPTMSAPATMAALAVAVCVTMAATLLGARAKARFAFGTSLAAESAGAVVLVVAAVAATIGTAGMRARWGSVAAVWIESAALAATALVLLRARAASADTSRETAPDTRAVVRDIYSVGALVLLDAVLFRRLEVYFLERSPDGLAGVAVLGLSLQIAAVAFLVPSALLEAWQPRVAALAARGETAFQGEVARRVRQFAPLMGAVVLTGIAITFIGVPLVFTHYREWLGYIAAFVLIRLVCAGAGFYSAALYAAGRHRALYAPALVSALVAIGANATLTARLGLRGAVLAYGATQVTLAALTIGAFYRMPRPERPVATPARAAGV
jgi:O-antigen/teichoic acid export membrane protein